MSTLYVRVKPKMGLQQFHRCAIFFTLAWQPFEVDAATKERLENEQMLETSVEKPEGYVEPAEVSQEPVSNAVVDLLKGAQDAAAGNTTAANPPVLSAEERLAAIKDAITGLDADVATNWLKSGAPSAPAITAVVGFDVTAAERDQVWAELEAERLADEAAAAAVIANTQAGAQ